MSYESPAESRLRYQDLARIVQGEIEGRIKTLSANPRSLDTNVPSFTVVNGKFDPSVFENWPERPGREDTPYKFRPDARVKLEERRGEASRTVLFKLVPVEHPTMQLRYELIIPNGNPRFNYYLGNQREYSEMASESNLQFFAGAILSIGAL